MMTEPHAPARVRIPVFAALIAYVFAMRVLPYILHRGFGMDVEYAYSAFPWNFSPIYAIAIFGGAFFTTRLALLLPIAVYFVSDMTIALLMGADWGFYRSQPITYAAFALLAACGMPLRERRSIAPIAVAGLGGAVMFFLVTNFGVWLVGGGLSHPKTPAGLMQCYVDGVPFFTRTLISQALFLPVLFSPLVLARTTARAEDTTASFS